MIRSSGLQVLSQARGRGDPDTAIYARARIQRAEITEDYYVQQQISVSPSTGYAAAPVGRIELAIPYDGRDFFTRQARDDVARATVARPRPGSMVTIGHLLLQDYGRTDLGTGLQLQDSHGSVPIRIPVPGGHEDSADSLVALIADEQTCLIEYDFKPRVPPVVPAGLWIDLYDPDSLELPVVDLMALNLSNPRDQALINTVLNKIRQQVSFQNELVLAISVRLSLPTESNVGHAEPRVSRMSIGWPTITSLRALSLRVENVRPDRNGEAPRVRYNPIEKCLEWDNVRMVPTGDDAKLREYRSATMYLAIQHLGEVYEIQHPGELAGTPESQQADEQGFLEVAADTEIPGYLLSGLTARLYDATGHLSGDVRPSLTTHIHSTAKLKLDDAFAKRVRSPYQHLFFDEIIPDDMRITDITTALRDRGFESKVIWPSEQERQRDTGSRTKSWLLGARRSEGPDNLELSIFVEGRHFTTTRETAVVGDKGGVTHRTDRDSGELKVYIRGTLERDSGKVTQEMNALQQALRERYDRVRERS